MNKTTILLTIPVTALLTQPLWAPQWGAGILGEIAAFGPVGSVIAMTIFFGLVALYCQSLKRLLEATRPEARSRTPRSIWLMFAIPFNFVEDFFIVADIHSSMRNDGRTAQPALRLWHLLGMAWCILQIGSLLPGTIGVTTGTLALIIWAWHWIYTALIHRKLANQPMNVG
ncbi:hypothetical protein [Timonella sp. A28]|uniref:hypothetical protein n=1 Tax=Timonella sp. A28 TaxID=3442640 RepID=UPI003EC02A32